MPMITPGGKQVAGRLFIEAEVTDIIDHDHHARTISFGKVNKNSIDSSPSPTVEFHKTAFKNWDRVFIKSSTTLVVPSISRTEEAFVLSFDMTSADARDSRPLGVFFDEISLGFANGDNELPEQIRYQVNGNLTDPKFSLNPSQVYWGPVIHDVAPTSDATKNVVILGVSAAEVDLSQTVFELNGVKTVSTKTPFAISVLVPSAAGSRERQESQSVELKISLAGSAMKAEDHFPKFCDRAYSIFIIHGRDNRAFPPQSISFRLPVFFTVNE